MPAIPTPPEPLSDGHLSLRLAAERDIPEVLIAHQDDPRLHARLGMARPPSGAELGRSLDLAASRRMAGESVTLAILEPDSDDCRGQLRVAEIDWEHGRATAELWLISEACGRGLERRALDLAARWLSDRCGIEHLVTETSSAGATE